MDTLITIAQGAASDYGGVGLVPWSIKKSGWTKNIELRFYFRGFTAFVVVAHYERFPLPELLVHAAIVGLKPMIGGSLFFLIMK